MAEFEWKIAKPSAQCSQCAAVFTPGQPYFSSLVQKEDGLHRRDDCAACFEANRPADVFYFWKTALPLPDAAPKRAKPTVDVEFVFDFFKRLEGDPTPQKIAFRYVLALMLSRKKVLSFAGMGKDSEGRDAHQFKEKQGGQLHAVLEPELSEDEITAVSAELGALLGIGAPPTKPEVAAAPVETASENAVVEAEEVVGAEAEQRQEA